MNLIRIEELAQLRLGLTGRLGDFVTTRLALAWNSQAWEMMMYGALALSA